MKLDLGGKIDPWGSLQLHLLGRLRGGFNKSLLSALGGSLQRGLHASLRASLLDHLWDILCDSLWRSH